eukprot:GHVT01049034.1.p1 GENE.GHVT01049034.1~~GHVT01049034.1.p1  ORF type:complete len:138 (-),score=7.89 GHVT01049034.1:270-683(-)
MSFLAYLSPRAMWHRLVSKHPTRSELEENFEAKYRESLVRYLTRTDTVEMEGSLTSGEEGLLAQSGAGPGPEVPPDGTWQVTGSPTSLQLITSAPVVRSTVATETLVEPASTDAAVHSPDGPGIGSVPVDEMIDARS